MKKLLVLAVVAIMIFAFAAIAMAEATFTGEVDTGYKSYAPNAAGEKDQSMPYIFGKVVMSGKLGDDVTGTMVIKSNGDPNCTSTPTATANSLDNSFQFDEADVTFTESFGSLKFGYFGWDNNPKDILDSLRGDTKSNFVASGAFKIAENFTLGLAYAIQPTSDKVTAVAADPATYTLPVAGVLGGESKSANSPELGIDLGYATDTLGVDLLSTQDSGYYKSNGDRASVTGIQAWYKIGDFKPFIQYEAIDAKMFNLVSGVIHYNAKAVTNEIIGFTYDSADSPVYARVETDLSKVKENGDKGNESGFRIGYKLADGAKIEAQSFTNRAKDNFTYLKLICAF
jgi:hypothetical protein